MRRWPVIGFGLAVLWLFVRGVELAVEPIVGEFLIGLAVGLPIAFAFRRFYLPEIALGDRLLGFPWVVVYLVTFLWELMTANVDVAYRVLAPSMPIDPDVIEVPLRVESDLAITTIANSITLTPGTLTMDYDDERNSLYVHAIDGRNPDQVVEPIRTWENYALRIFDEERTPDDPVPLTPDHDGSAIEPESDEVESEADIDERMTGEESPEAIETESDGNLGGDGDGD